VADEWARLLTDYPSPLRPLDPLLRDIITFGAQFGYTGPAVYKRYTIHPIEETNIITSKLEADLALHRV
jgi:hypothetical protein